MIPNTILTSSTSSSCSTLLTNSSEIQRTSSTQLKRSSRYQTPRTSNNNSNFNSMRNESWEEWDQTCNPIATCCKRSQQSVFGCEQSSWCLSTQSATSAVFVGRSILNRSSYSTNWECHSDWISHVQKTMAPCIPWTWTQEVSSLGFEGKWRKKSYKYCKSKKLRILYYLDTNHLILQNTVCCIVTLLLSAVAFRNCHSCNWWMRLD